MAALYQVQVAPLLPLAQKRRRTRAKGFQSRFALSSCDPLVVQYAQKSMAEPPIL